jgi:Na+/phosphate symporter
MGDGLKNSSGTALKRVLEKVTGNVVMGVLTGAMVTAVIQSSTATIVLTVALIGAGVLTLKQAVAIVMGANIGTTVTAQIIRLSDIEAGDNWFMMLFDTDTLAPIALVIGIILVMFIKTKSAKTIGFYDINAIFKKRARKADVGSRRVAGAFVYIGCRNVRKAAFRHKIHRKLGMVCSDVDGTQRL